MSYPGPAGHEPALTRRVLCFLAGRELQALFEERLAPMPLCLVELLARLCVAEAMVEFDRLRAGTQGGRHG